MKMVLLMVVVVLCLSACTWFIQTETEEETEPIGEVDSIITISGNLIETIDDCIFDGMCAFVIETEAHGTVTVIWSEGDSPNCANNMFGEAPYDEFQISDTIEAMGRVISADALTTCGDESSSAMVPIQSLKGNYFS